MTIVDLTGLIHSETKQQSAADVHLVQEVVRSYMTEPRSVILAVISAKNDFANQIVLRLARETDSSGSRTLGVITKPDSLVAGSESEAQFASLAKNQEVEFRLGWHVLKNMDSEKGKWNLVEHDMEELQFFSQGVWQDMPQTLVGINYLRARLSKLLLGQIATELPSLLMRSRLKARRAAPALINLENHEPLWMSKGSTFSTSASPSNPLSKLLLMVHIMNRSLKMCRPGRGIKSAFVP